MEGYGRLVSISSDSITVYHQVGSYCVADSGLVAPFSLYSFDARPGRLSLLHADYGPENEAPQLRVDLGKLEALPESCTSGSGQASTSPGRVARLLWSAFRDHFAFFDQRGVDWDSVGRQYLPQADTLRDTSGLFPLLSDMLAPLGDGHVNLYRGDSSFNAGQSSIRLRARLAEAWHREGGEGSEGEFVGAWHRTVQESVYGVLDAGSLRQAAAGALEWGTIRDSVAYVRMNRFSRLAEGSAPRPAQLDTLRAALRRMSSDIQDAKGVVVDVALNGGGMDAAAFVVAGCFADRPREALSKAVRGGHTQAFTLQPHCPLTFSGPVVLLTSEVTASAAETFVLLMRSLPNVTHVGGRTRGITSSLLPIQLPEGFVVTLSHMEMRDSEGMLYEATGIPPHVGVELFPDGELHTGFTTALTSLADSLQAL